MKYSADIIINIPRDKGIELMDSWENMYKWMDGLESHKYLSGEEGQEGAKTEMIFKMKNREVKMVETILKRNFPHSFDATYEAKGVFNTIWNTFEEIDENSYRWTQTTAFEFNGFMMKFMSFLMPGAFKKQTMKYLENFKKFAEEEYATQSPPTQKEEE